jgi:hypothetical protein
MICLQFLFAAAAAKRKRRKRAKRSKIEEQVSSLFHGDSFIFGLIAQAARFYVL